MMWSFIRYLVTVIVVCISACRGAEHVPIASQAHQYKVIGVWLEGTQRRQKHFNIIADDVVTPRQAVHTVVKAAIDMRALDPDYDVFVVHLAANKELESGFDIAVATFAPDGRGYSGHEKWTWQAEVASPLPSARDVSIVQLWEKNRNAYLDQAGHLDEPALKARVAKEIGSEVLYIPWWTPKLQALDFEKAEK